MTVLFVTRLHKTKSVQRKDGKFPIVLQVTWDRKVRRKRLGIYAHEHQITIYKDLKRKKIYLAKSQHKSSWRNFIDY